MGSYDETSAAEDAASLLRQAFAISADAVLPGLGPSEIADYDLISTFFTHLRGLHFANEAIDEEIDSLSQIARDIGRESIGVVRKVCGGVVRDCSDFAEAGDLFLHGDYPFSIPCSILIGEQDVVSRGRVLLNGAVEKQLRKDVGRERLVLNSQLCLGAALGLEGILQRMISLCSGLFKGRSLPPPPPHIIQEFCEISLLKSSRTHSGGMALSAIQAVVDLSKNVLVPLPSATSPVRITLRLGTAPGLRGWGLTAQVYCDFAYLVRSHDMLADDPEQDLSVPISTDKGVCVVYEDAVLCAINTEGECEVVNNSSLSGSVKFVESTALHAL